MATAKLLETVYQESIERVDAEQGILFGVKVLGESSRNSRRYAPDAMREAVGKYDGVKSYVDHPDRDRLREDRKFSAWSGVFKNPRYVEGKGIYADLHLRQKGTYFEGIIEAAQKFPTAVGFSHVAEGESHLDGETEIVESIREVFSVDLVTDPATTAGMFESHSKPIKFETTELREAVNGLPETEPLRKRLTEMMDGSYMGMGMGGEEKAPSDLASAMALIGQLTSALADALKSLAKANKPEPVLPTTVPPTDTPPGEENPAEEEDEEMTDEDKQKVAAFEALQRENAELLASKLLLESGRQATTVRIKALANCQNEVERTELLESWPKLEAAPRPARSPGAIDLDTDFPRDNTEKFAALLR